MTIVGRMTARLLRRGLGGLAALLIGAALFQLVQALVVESIGASGLSSLLDTLPPALRTIARAQPEFLALSGLAGYLSFGFTHPLYLVLACSALVGYTSRGLAGEMERGTIQIALSRAISRRQVYGARVLGLLAIAIGLAASGVLGLLAGLLYAQPEGDFAYGNLAPTMVSGALLFWAIGGLTLLGSAAANTGGRAVAWALTGLVVSYFVDYFAGIWDFLLPFEPFSVFDYYDPTQALVAGVLPWTNVLVLALTGLAGVVGGMVVFVRRDLP